MSGGFLSRWSRRKLAAVAQAEAAPPVAGESPAALQPGAAEPLAAAPAAPEGAAEAGALPVGAVEASLPAVESLSLSSDFTAFLKEEVSEALRRKALRKLFSDPHFNQMDGLDIYIDDYSQPDPIPPEILAKLRHAREWLMDDAAAGPVADGGAIDAAVPVAGDGGQARVPEEGAGAESACASGEAGDSAEAEAAEALEGRRPAAASRVAPAPSIAGASAADLSATDSSPERASPEGGNASGR
ncbi:MAG: DUF3306 domain-containing protein [Thauera sp.]|nr:DUF3306 domain-containing protein [Thauera sp.]